MLPLLVETRIHMVRGFKVIIDADLAELYGVQTRVLNQAVRRNLERFPADFMFDLNAEEFAHWRSQVVISNPGAKMGLRRPPYAFTEHGALMAATILNSPRAVEMSLYVVRAFVQLREVLSSHRELAKRLDDIEDKTEALAMQHDTFSRNTRTQLKQVFDALRELMTPPEPAKRPIGFVVPKERGRDNDQDRNKDSGSKNKKKT
jgi:hypothetical protein